MKFDDAKTMVGLLVWIRSIDELLVWLDKEDQQQEFGPSRRISWVTSENGPALSADAARRIRAIMRDDYITLRAGFIQDLAKLGVDPPPDTPDELPSGPNAEREFGGIAGRRERI